MTSSGACNASATAAATTTPPRGSPTTTGDSLLYDVNRAASRSPASRRSRNSATTAFSQVARPVDALLVLPARGLVGGDHMRFRGHDAHDRVRNAAVAGFGPALVEQHDAALRVRDLHRPLVAVRHDDDFRIRIRREHLFFGITDVDAGDREELWAPDLDTGDPAAVVVPDAIRHRRTRAIGQRVHEEAERAERCLGSGNLHGCCGRRLRGRHAHLDGAEARVAEARRGRKTYACGCLVV